MKHTIFIILLISVVQRLILFVKENKKEKGKPFIALFIAIIYIISTISYFNMIYTFK